MLDEKKAITSMDTLLKKVRDILSKNKVTPEDSLFIVRELIGDVMALTIQNMESEEQSNHAIQDMMNFVGLKASKVVFRQEVRITLNKRPEELKVKNSNIKEIGCGRTNTQAIIH